MKTIGRYIMAGCSALSLVGCHSVPPRAAKCEFHYDDKVLQSVVIPAMRAKLGDGGETLYDLSRPFIDEERGNVFIVFMYKNERAMDPPRFELTLDPCSMRVVKAEATTVITPD